MRFIQIDAKKRPIKKEYYNHYSNHYDNWENASFLIGNEVIILDFDGDNSNETQIMDYIEREYPTLIVTTTRGKHFYYRLLSKSMFPKLIKGKSCLGFQCDYLTGEKTPAVIKLNGKVREMNKKFSYDNMAVLPVALYPLKKGEKLSGMIKGSGRNDGLFKHLMAVRRTFPEININVLANDINNNIFAKKLDNSELNGIIKSVKKQKVDVVKKKEIVYSSFDELQKKKLPPMKYYVKGLIPQGLTIIASLPKIGKSWMMLDMGLSVATGKEFLGFETKKAGVLYLALEDGEKRLQSRINILLNNKEKAPHNFKYAIRCDDLGNGLISELEDIKRKEPNIEVIVIDTLQKIRRSYKGSNVYANDYKELSELKDFADKYDISVIAIHHLKKGFESDAFAKISGTNGITGTVDTNITIEKEDRFENEATLNLDGRDVINNQYIIRFDKNKCKWHMVGTYEENLEQRKKEDYYNDPLITIIKSLIEENNGEWSGTFKEIKSRLISSYSNIIDPVVNKKRLKPLLPLLKKYDGIEFYQMKNAKDGKRIIIFKKM